MKIRLLTLTREMTETITHNHSIRGTNSMTLESIISLGLLAWLFVSIVMMGLNIW